MAPDTTPPSPAPPRAPARRRRARPAFTLIETALATVIIGVGVLALVEAHDAFLRSNGWSTQSATATYLANEIRELSRTCERHDPVSGLYTHDEDGETTLVGWGLEADETAVADIDDLDDLDGLTFGAGGDFPGPIDAFGNVIPQLLADGTVMTDGEGNPVPMQGWFQSVTVEKIDPFNTDTVRDHDYQLPPDGDFKGLRVDRFPLRVTVTVWFQGPDDEDPREAARVVWIVP